MITLGVPLRWGMAVRKDILKMCYSIYRNNKSKEVFIPKYQKTVDLEKYKFTDKIISYHTISSQDELDNSLRLNWKISPFKGFFTFDMKGYSGFGYCIKKRVDLLGLNGDEIESRAKLFLEKKVASKYVVKNSDSKNRKKRLIIVGQLADDNVAKLRFLNDDEVKKVAEDICDKLGLQLYFRPHPLSKNEKFNLPIDKSNFSELKKSGAIVLTQNSGYGIHCVYHGIKTVFLAPNEFIDVDIDKIKSNPVEYVLSTINNFNIENFYEYFSSLICIEDDMYITRIIDKFIIGPNND